MPRVRVEDFDDFDDEFDIDDEDPQDRAGRRSPPPRPTKQDKDWEERRKELINRKIGKDHRD